MFLIEAIQTDNNTELVIFSRNKSGKKIIEKVRDFRPYFYVNDDERIPEDARITGIETGYKSITGKKLKKIYVRKSMYVSQLRDRFQKHYESDIVITQRYIIDVIGEAEVYPLKILSMDIETNYKDTFPDMENPDQEIISTSFTDNRGKRQAFLYKSPECKKDIKESEQLKIFKTEEELLVAILAYIKQEDPDVLTGWYVDGFDLTYLIRRMSQFDIDYRKLSPLGAVWIDEKYGDVYIKGRIILDMMKGYIHFRGISNQGRADDYSLETTAQQVLGKSKLQHQEVMQDMWINNPDELIEYNQRDADLVIEINEKLEIIEFFNYIRAKSYSQLTSVYQTTTLVDGYLLRMVHDDIVLPSKSKTKGSKSYSGAFVLEPKPGIFEYVLALDVKGMYPNIIKTFNVGYETFNPQGEIQLKPGIGFDMEEGMVSKAMRKLEKERNHYKKLMNNSETEEKKKLNYYKQYAMKVLMNSFYGYLGYPGSRLYKREIAEAITTWGQLIIKRTAEFLEKKEYEILYGDTDSVYIQSKNKELLKILKEGTKLRNEINTDYIEFSKTFGAKESTLEIEFEKALKKVLFVGKRGTDVGAKKKYAYIPLWIDGSKAKDEITTVGFESVRSDTAKISKKVQQDVVKMILYNKTKEDIVDYLKKMDRGIRNGEISVEDFGFPKGISKDLKEYGKEVEDEDGRKTRSGIPPVIVGAKYSNKYLGTRFIKGTKPKWTYIKHVPIGYPDTHVLSFRDEIPKGFIPDYNIVIEKLFKAKLEEIFKSAGFGAFPEIDSNKKNLSQYFEVKK